MIAFTGRGKLLQLRLTLNRSSDLEISRGRRVNSNTVRDLLFSIDSISQQLDKSKLVSNAYNSVLEQLAFASVLASQGSNLQEDDKTCSLCSMELVIKEFGHKVVYMLAVTVTNHTASTLSPGWSIKTTLHGGGPRHSTIQNKLVQLVCQNTNNLQTIEVPIHDGLLRNLPLKVSVHLLYSLEKHVMHLLPSDVTMATRFNQLIQLPLLTRTFDLLDTLRTYSPIAIRNENIVEEIAKRKPSYHLHVSASSSDESADKSIIMKIPSGYMLDVYNKKLLVGGKCFLFVILKI